MCGIAAIVDLPSSGNEKELKPSAFGLANDMVDRLRSRGPDDSAIELAFDPTDDNSAIEGGQYLPEIVLGHTRLAIVGKAEARSPFLWSKNIGQGVVKKMLLIHNGEIYNHKDLREELVREGRCHSDAFQTGSDSEVLVACCLEKGIEFTLSRVRGMFAFVLVEWNEHMDRMKSIEVVRIIASRDTFGIKPLCYALDESGRRLIFASQVSAIPRYCGLDEGSICLKDIIPGTFVEISFSDARDRLDVGKCQHFASIEFNKKVLREGIVSSGFKSFRDGQWLKQLRSKFIDAVSCRIPPQGTVKMAVLLSGGLDSSLVASVSASLRSSDVLHTFNIRYDNKIQTPAVVPPESDQFYARLVQQHLQCQHEEFVFSFQDGLDVLPGVIESLETYDAVCVRAGVPLYLLSKHVASRGFKVVLCGEGADEVFAGYRLFERFLPMGRDEETSFTAELCRRLENIDSSELQRVDRCTSAHGLEARVPFLDLAFVAHAMQLPAKEKMSHSALGRIQKFMLRLAFDDDSRVHQHSIDTESSGWLPSLILYREKEQFSDGVGRGWVQDIQTYAMESEGILDGQDAEKALYKRLFETDDGGKLLGSEARVSLVKDRNYRRQRGLANKLNSGTLTGTTQTMRWFSASSDVDIQKLGLTKDDSRVFLESVLGWSVDDCVYCKPTLETLNRLILSMLERVPFHNLTLLTRERRPPTMDEIRADMMNGIGGPCAVVNTFFAAMLVTLGFGPNVFLLSCQIYDRPDSHVAVLVQLNGLRYFVDVANAKPYTEAVHLGDSSRKKSLNGTFEWNLSFITSNKRIELNHFGRVALSFDPTVTVPFDSFRQMIKRSRSDPSFGPFLTGLRFCLYPDKATKIKAVRDIHIYDGRTTKEPSIRCVSTEDEIIDFARNHFSHINSFCLLVETALTTLNRECAGWFERAAMKLRAE